MTRIALVPGVLALSSRYGSLEDPVADLRTAVTAALDWVGPDPRVVGDGHGVIAGLLAERAAGSTGEGDAASAAPGRGEPGSQRGETRISAVANPDLGVVVVANGSAKRTEKAPGHFDERALAFDDWLREALTVAPGDLAHLDHALAEELWADVEALGTLSDLLTGPKPADFAPAETDQGPQRPQVRLIGVDYDDDPYGVKYWVIRWEVQ
ncbi:hypothetical protein [Nocardioides sp.]|uniref:hypothetical protein n=1 Tax=Nocardioides sp. TaxID=35761 RepID=UPI002623FF0A|nr:hypothetical protein [Nocardioides sp.]